MKNLKATVIWVLIFALAAIDQGIKYLVIKKIPFNSAVTVIDSFFYITYWKNTGAAWGIFQGNRMFLILITIVAMVFLFYIFQKFQQSVLPFAIALIAGGAIGNLIDRVFRGGVVDFLLFDFGKFTFPAFNFADSCIVVGTAVLVIMTIFMDRKEEKGEEQRKEVRREDDREQRNRAQIEDDRRQKNK